MRRAKRFYRKATGRRYSKKGGRFHKHTLRRQKRRGYQGHAKGGYFQKRKRGHFIPHKGKKYWIDMEHVPEEAVEAYFKRGSSGRKNPRGRDGNIMLCHECGSDEHLIAKCPMKKNSLTSAHYSHGQDIVTPNGVMQYATPTYVHAGVIHASVPYGSTGTQVWRHPCMNNLQRKQTRIPRSLVTMIHHSSSYSDGMVLLPCPEMQTQIANGWKF